MAEAEDQQKGKGQPAAAGVEEDCTGLMEEILEKLKLLNYEKNFLEQKGLKPLNTAYFAVPMNQHEQFNYFKTLVKWLFQLNELQAGDYAKYDDPVTVSQNIQFELKKINIECDFPPIKLKSGSGDQVCSVLLQLINRAMKVKKFAFKKPNIQAQAQTEDEPAMEEEGDNLDMAENIEASDDELEENINDVGAPNEVAEEKQVIESKVDQKEWILECERVAPRLKFTLKSEGKEWRAHIEQTRTYSENIKKILPSARDNLEKMSDDLGKVLERIIKREKNINVNMTEKGAEYKVQAEELKKIANKYNLLNQAVREKGEEYRNLQEKWDSIQTKTNEHGNNVTDSSPIVKIKTAIQKLRHEIKSMDLRIGLLNHTVLQHKFKEKKTKEEKKYDVDGMNYMANNIDDLDEY